MHLPQVFAFAAALPLISATAVLQCPQDKCFKGIKSAKNGLLDCSNNMRQTVTPAATTVTRTILIARSTTLTSWETQVTDTTTTLQFFETETDTMTETPTTTTSTTSTIQPHTGAGGVDKRDPLGHFPMPTSDVDELVARAVAAGKTGHFPDTVEIDQDFVDSTNSSVSKRDLLERGNSMPSYASCCGTMDKYLSACACNGVRKATTTLPRKTILALMTSTTTMTSMVTSTTTQVNILSESSTSTTETSTTTTTTSTSTYSTSILASPTCTSFVKGPNPSWVYNYRLEYAGFQTLNPNNPGNNAQAPPIFQTYSGDLSTCDAADQCTTFAGTTFSPPPLNMGGYFTINLQYRDATYDWLCAVYFDQSPASYYNVDSPDVNQSFGWTKRP